MSGTTPVSSLRYATLGDSPNANTLSQNLATDLDHLVIPKYANSTARNTANPTPTTGDLCYVTSVGYQTYTGAAWVTLGGMSERRINLADVPGTAGVQTYNTNSFADVTSFGFSLVASATYDFTWHIVYGFAATPGIQVQFTTPAGANIEWSGLSLDPSVTGASTGTMWGTARGSSAQALGGDGSSNANRFALRIEGQVITGVTAGNIQLQAAQVVTTAGAGNAAVIAVTRSFASIRRIA